MHRHLKSPDLAWRCLYVSLKRHSLISLYLSFVISKTTSSEISKSNKTDLSVCVFLYGYRGQYAEVHPAIEAILSPIHSIQNSLTALHLSIASCGPCMSLKATRGHIVPSSIFPPQSRTPLSGSSHPWHSTHIKRHALRRLMCVTLKPSFVLIAFFCFIFNPRQKFRT